MYTSVLLLAVIFLLGNKIYQVHSDDPNLKLEPIYRSVARNLNENYSVKCYNDETDNTIRWRDPLWKQIPKTNDSNTRLRVEPTEDLVNYSTLIIENIQEKDAGIYTCGSRSAVSASFSLKVLHPISFEETDAQQFAVLGYPYTVKCTVRQQANRNLTIWWRINGEQITVDSSRMARLNQGLLINKVNKNDAEAEYICRAIDLKAERPHLKHQKICLTVLKKNFTVSTMHGLVGETSYLQCTADSHLSTASNITFKWYDKFSKEITENYGRGMCITQTSRFHSILQVPIKDSDSYGTFICTMGDGNRTFGHKITLTNTGVSNSNMPTVSPDIFLCEPPFQDITTQPPTSDPHAMDSVELFPSKDFVCEDNSYIRISVAQVCDGIPDCPKEDDEDVILCQGPDYLTMTTVLPLRTNDSLVEGPKRNETVITFKTQTNTSGTTTTKMIMVSNEDGSTTTTTITNSEQIVVITSNRSMKVGDDNSI